MKILQIGPYPPPLGGWAIHMKFFKDYLTEKGIPNDVMNIGANRKVKSAEYVDIQNGFDYIIKNIKFILKGYHFYCHVDGGSTKGFILTLSSLFVSLLFGKRMSINFHAGVNQKCFNGENMFSAWMAKIMFVLTKTIICNSENVKENIMGMGIPADKIHPIPCFSKQYLHYKERILEDQRRFCESHKPLISTYAFFNEEYTIDILLYCLKKIKIKYPRVGLILIGGTRGDVEIEHRQKIISLAKEFDLSDNLFLAGDLSHDNFLSLMKKSDLVIRTYLRDGVCSSVLEAVALKVPVIATKNETRPKGVITYEGGHCDDLYQKTEYALEHLDELKAGLTSVEERDTLEEELRVLLIT